ncbi:MAG: nickel pincer cofactor biosynthesis protein LarC [Eubacteriaceae bacterium]|jgi:uncharacterized protein (TIGR00299 family) protein|nr:nickel pincer cofactor biosynthesis protein LarC [Eubacteriaceae bacterium]
MKILYFDCYSGISGDMVLGAFIDAGVPAEHLISSLNQLSVDGFHLEISKTTKGGISGTSCRVVIDRHEHVHRHYSDIEKIIVDSQLPEEVAQTALNIFKRVARAEAKVHNISFNRVHFHEVGAIDSIVDIVGAAICFHYLKPQRVYCSAINTGSGFVQCDHGILPVPAPATAEILTEVEIPMYAKFIDGESATPTGVAILAELATYTENIPPIKLKKIAYGFGEKEFKILNALRLLLGDAENQIYGDTITVLETNIDDMTGENAGYVMEKLFELPVRDAFYTSIYMKKNRPALRLTVICDEEQIDKVQALLFKETSTIGIRRTEAERAIMGRDFYALETPYGEVKIKKLVYDDISKEQPEYEDIRKIAQKTGKGFNEVMSCVQAMINK